MNRRSFIKGLVGVSAALILPPEPERRFWALDQTMMKGQGPLIESGWFDTRYNHPQLFVTTVQINNPDYINPSDTHLLIGGEEVVRILGVHNDGSIVIGRGPGVYRFDQVGTLENVSFTRKPPILLE